MKQEDKHGEYMKIEKLRQREQQIQKPWNQSPPAIAEKHHRGQGGCSSRDQIGKRGNKEAEGSRAQITQGFGDHVKTSTPALHNMGNQ